MRQIDINSVQDSYDVVIIGAGPAGCLLGRNISNKYRTLIIDRDCFPREKPCGGILVEETVESIRELDLKIPQKVFSEPKNPQFVVDDWTNNLQLKLARDFLNVDRKEFDYWLLSLIPNDVDILPSTTLIDYDSTKTATHAVIRSGDVTRIIRCHYLIGADGASSIIRRKLSFAPIRRYLVIQDVVERSADINDVYFIYDNEITDFYSWVIPKGKEMLLATAICFENSKQKVDLFRKKLQHKFKITLNHKFIRREAAVGCRPSSLKDIEFGKKNIFLVGEAAGFISPSSGEGIGFALRSGNLLSEAMKTNFKDPLEHYAELCEPLIDDMREKLLKSRTFSDPVKRKDYYYKTRIESQEGSVTY